MTNVSEQKNKNLFGFLFVLSMVFTFACQQVNPKSTLTTDARIPLIPRGALDADRFVQGQFRNLTKLTRAVTQLYPPDAYTYLYLGRSPTVLYGMMGYQVAGHFALPFSDVDKAGSLIYAVQPGSTYFLKKLFDHLDVYLRPLIRGWVSQTIPPKIVTVDFCASGSSMGHFLAIFEMYLRHTYRVDPLFAAWVDRRNKELPESHFLCLTHTSDGESLDLVIQKKLLEHSKMRPSINGAIEALGVPPGYVLGHPEQRVTVKVEDFKAVLSIDPRRYKGRGRFLNMYQQFPSLWLDLNLQNFDEFSPYGSWTLEKSPLEKDRPPVRAEFLMLHQKIKNHRTLMEKILTTLGCEPKVVE